MLKKKIVLTIVGLGISLCALIAAFGHFRKLPSTTKDNSYFIVAPVTKWTKGNCPCLTVRIGDKTISAKLDLGFRGYGSIAKAILQQIAQKKLLGSQVMYDFQGNPEKINVFQIENIQIGNKYFKFSKIQEDIRDIRTQAIFVKDGEEPYSAEPGRIGWEIFQNTPLLLDLKNEKIVFCDNLSTLKNQGYQIDQFVQAPLLLERGLVEVEAKLDTGVLRCVLDTGCTFNILNIENKQNKSMSELFWDKENFYISDKCQINEKEFGPITFRQIPIRLPIHIDSILGMDFLMEHIIFLDFPNNLVYFHRNKILLSEVGDTEVIWNR